jgi:hypothetical protein
MSNRQSSHPRAQLTTVFIPRPHETRKLHRPLEVKRMTKEERWRHGEGAAQGSDDVLVGSTGLKKGRIGCRGESGRESSARVFRLIAAAVRLEWHLLEAWRTCN